MKVSNKVASSSLYALLEKVNRFSWKKTSKYCSQLTDNCLPFLFLPRNAWVLGWALEGRQRGNDGRWTENERSVDGERCEKVVTLRRDATVCRCWVAWGGRWVQGREEGSRSQLCMYRGKHMLSQYTWIRLVAYVKIQYVSGGKHMLRSILVSEGENPLQTEFVAYNLYTQLE
jgi:hypothetical protein